MNWCLSLLLVLAFLLSWLTRDKISKERSQRCAEVMKNASTTAVSSSGETPPHSPPTNILQSLTINNFVPLEFYYVDDTNKGKGTHYKYSRDDIEHFIHQADNRKSIIYNTLQQVDGDVNQAWKHYTKSVDWLMMALHTYPIRGSEVVVFGSTEPWIEAIALAFGASHVTTVEYNRLTYDHPHITTTTPNTFYQNHYENLHYDAAFSISSFDHDGLGRYGDPIDPNADMTAMQLVRCVLKPNGLLFLTVPIGPDVIVWNLHRRYGTVRLPKLLEKWTQEDVVGWDIERLTRNVSWRISYEPVFVLRNSIDV
ncbi:uncharacterized protein LOC134190498 [Corticium candelabrum]|uniref:uncharacterized protein LOC134190498 n=1 Tax=Corticium candelabrum TaxID=121492 RepID=UPI002E26EB72|nr:uncharacterized protein LOC134190498 [Corticium candelabrum]